MQPLHGLSHSEIIFQKVVLTYQGDLCSLGEYGYVGFMQWCIIENTESVLQSAAWRMSLVVIPFCAAALTDAPLVE